MSRQFKEAILAWICIYPLITILVLAVDAMPWNMPVFIDTLIVTLAAVPINSWILQPLAARIARSWIDG